MVLDNLENIIIIGGGGHAKIVACILKKHPSWVPIGYFAAIGIAQGVKGDLRMQIIHKIEEYGLKFPSIVSPHSIVNEGVIINDGTIIMDGAVVQPGARIGKYSIINTGSTVDHDCQIGSNVHIAPGANLSGHVVVGNNVLVGIGAKIIQGVSICTNATLGAGAVATKSIKVPGVYIGIPARVHKMSANMG